MTYPINGEGKKIYIAGPMRGYKHYNFLAFDEAEKKLREAGWCPISPAALDRINEGWGKYPPEIKVDDAFKRRVMRRDLACVFECDAIYMLKGWGDSDGALAELALAEFLNLEIHLEGFENTRVK